MGGHLRRLMEMPDVEIVGLTDPKKASFERLFTRVPEAKELPQFADHKDMLATVDMDAVEISTPHTLHFRQIMDSLDRGLIHTNVPTLVDSSWLKRRLIDRVVVA